MLNTSQANLDTLIVHHVGNQTQDEELILSAHTIPAIDPQLNELLLKYFLQSFEDPEFYNFTFSNEDPTMNPMFQFSTKIFDDDNFKQQSVDIAKHLFEIVIHPNIKSGDLFVAHFSNLLYEDELVDGVGIFKSENKHSFLKLFKTDESLWLSHDKGIYTEKLDKACLVLNTSKEYGYKVCILDKSNKSIEAAYWRDSFLNLKPASDDYHQTKEFLGITRKFVTKQLDEEFDVDKTDKIDLLNRSVEYFKNHEEFDKDEFTETVFQDPGVIQSFNSFDTLQRQESKIEISDTFEINEKAVKRQQGVFKSVLKLDKNFHVYIHGDKDLIEKGVEQDGRKFYKIYYDEED